MSVRASTIGKPKLDTTNPIVRKIVISRHGLVPTKVFCIERLAKIVGITDNM